MPRGASRLHEIIAAVGIDIGDHETRRPGLDQGEGHRRARPAGADNEGALSARLAAGALKRRDHGGAVRHVARPTAVPVGTQEIDSAENARALGRLVAMGERRKLVRHRDDDAVDVAHLFRRRHDGVEVRGRDMQGHADRVDLARLKFARQAGRRLRLRDRIADDQVKPRRAIEEFQHDIPFGDKDRGKRSERRDERIRCPATR